MDVLHKAVLVTGSTSGIGREIAQRLADAGASVILTGRRRDLGLQVVAEIAKNGGKAVFFEADLTQDSEIADLVEFAAQQFDGLDILVNNAGMVPRNPDGSMADGPLHQTEPEYWDRIWHLDLRSLMQVSWFAIPHLLESSKAPAIINIASVHAVQGCGMDVYSAIKGGVVALSRSMAVSYAPRIRVNCISPGMVVVERTAEMLRENPEMITQFEEGYLTRIGEPADVAELCLVLCGRAGEYVTGSNIVMDGGMSIFGTLPPGPVGSREKLRVAPASIPKPRHEV